VLESHGYLRFHAVEGDQVTNQALYQRAAGDVLHNLDVHWKISNPVVFADAFSYAELLAECVRVETLGPHAIAPSYVHSLMIACIHKVAHHHTENRPEWLQDIRLLYRALSSEQISHFVDLSVRKKLAAVCLAGIRQAAENSSTASDKLLTPLIHAASTSTEPSAIFLDPGFSRFDLILSNLSNLSMFKRIQLMLEMLFPPAGYLQVKYPGTPPFLTPYLYFRRIVEGLRKLFSL
jgi:hypothetical protein